MARLAEYYHDPHAPAVNLVWPSGFAAVRGADGRLLLARRADSGNWELPGGKVDIGESITDAVLREVAEETGLRIAVTGLLGVYTDPDHVLVDAGGVVRQQFALCFEAVPVSGLARPDHEENTEVGWFRAADLPRLPMHPSMRLQVEHALRHTAHAVIG
jgi:8-oxo-dGTP pyrophosphatase MutT (NUDIX family)